MFIPLVKYIHGQHSCQFSCQLLSNKRHFIYFPCIQTPDFLHHWSPNAEFSSFSFVFSKKTIILLIYQYFYRSLFFVSSLCCVIVWIMSRCRLTTRSGSLVIILLCNDYQIAILLIACSFLSYCVFVCSVCVLYSSFKGFDELARVQKKSIF